MFNCFIFKNLTYISLYYSHYACFIIFYIINICMCRTLLYSSFFEAGTNVSALYLYIAMSYYFFFGSHGSIVAYPVDLHVKQCPM